MTKNAARREKFRKLGAMITKMGDPDAKDYYTGRSVGYHLRRGDSLSRDAADPLNKAHDSRVEVPLGPRFATPQWVRAV